MLRQGRTIFPTLLWEDLAGSVCPVGCIKPYIYMTNEYSQLCTNFVLMGHQSLTSDSTTPGVAPRAACIGYNILCLRAFEGTPKGRIFSVTVCAYTVEVGTMSFCF